MTWAARRIDMSLLQAADMPEGVLKAATLADAGEARSVMARAERDADALRANAQAEAHQALQHQRAALEQQRWQQTAAYAQAVQAAWDTSLTTLEDRLAATLERALHRLVEQVPPEERLRACVRQLLDEAGTPDTGVLLVNPAMLGAVQSLGEAWPWPVKGCDELPPGTVRLLAEHGHWDCGPDTTLDQLMAALTAGPDRKSLSHA